MKKFNKPAAPTANIALPAPHSINFYGALQEARETQEEYEERMKLEKRQILLDNRPSFSYTPGMIVKIDFLTPCPDIKEFKKDMRQYPYVKYVDIEEGCSSGYVRTTSTHTSEDLIKELGTSEILCSKLNGTFEALYWEKIVMDRSQKLTNTIPVRNEPTHTAVGPKHVRFTE